MTLVHSFTTSLTKGVLATHVATYRRSGGRLGGHLGKTPLLLLTTTGRKSGQQRTRPLAYLPDGDSFIVCGSNGGSDAPPAWVFNLQANPAAVAEVKQRRLDVVASEVTGPEYEPLWQRFSTANPNFVKYQTKTQRHLPLFRLTAR
jgi:deazaflavin-dependent oxidoreductase (nitroreductase family)